MDLAGKGKSRPDCYQPPPAESRGDDRLAAASFSAGPLLGAVNQGDRIAAREMRARSIYQVVEACSDDLGSRSLPRPTPHLR